MITVATDASIRGTESAWGAVVTLPSRVLYLGGRLQTTDSSEAELWAALHGLQSTRRNDRVELVCDQYGCVGWLRGRRPPARVARLVTTLRQMLAVRNGCVRWTRAHCRDGHPLHREADRLASGRVPSCRSTGDGAVGIDTSRAYSWRLAQETGRPSNFSLG